MGGLDDIDYSILQLLQQDARKQTPVDMAEKLPVSDQTVRNRIADMESEGVIEGYIPLINYEKADFPIRLKFTCTAPVQQREEFAKKVLGIPHVVHVEEMLSSRENLQILAVTNDSEKINTIAEKLDELGLVVESERLLRYTHIRPFNHFGTELISDE